MRIQRFLGAMVAMCAIVAAVILYNVQSVRGSDHQDSTVMLNHPAADITDVFVYPSPANSSNVVLQMDVDPLLTHSTAQTAALDPNVLYQFRIANGSYTAGSGFSATADDQVIQIKANVSGTGQTVSIYGPAAPPSGGTSTNQTLLPTAAGTVNFNQTSATAFANGMKVFVGPRSDPFFFDLAQFFRIIPDRAGPNASQFASNPATSFQGFANATFTLPALGMASAHTANNCLTTQATDFLTAGQYNVLAIIIEMPKTLLENSAGNVIGVHATSSTTSGS